METYIDWRLSSVLSLLALVCLSICCLLLSFLKLTQVYLGMVVCRRLSTVELVSIWSTSVSQSGVRCFLVLWLPSWHRILDNFLKGEQLKKMAMVTILPVVHYALVPHRGVHSTLEGPN